MKFFKRDILVLLLVSVFVGTAAAKVVSYGANLYFQETLVSLVGDYGEYDLVLQMREDYVQEGKAQLENVLAENFPGAEYKEGPKIIGKANFFIALPKEKKNQAVYENLDRIFSAVPGVSGVSILTEPRLNVRGIPPGAMGALEQEFKAVDGVHFVYRGSGAIGIVLDGIDKIAGVTNKIENALVRNKIIDIGFPVGVEADNPVLLAENITKEIHAKLRPAMAQYVSVDTSNNDMVYLISTMQEIRRFLLTYATKVTLVVEGKKGAAVGDKFVFQGNESDLPAPGDPVTRRNVVAMVTGANKDGSYSGIITQGDAASFGGKEGRCIVDSGTAGQTVARASLENPRVVLLKALAESADLMEKLPILIKEGNLANEKIAASVKLYQENSKAIKQSAENMDQAALTMRAAAERLENANIKGLKEQVDQSLKSINGLVAALRLISVFNADAANATENLQNTREKLQGFSELLAGMNEITEDAGRAKNILTSLSRDGGSFMAALDNFDNSKTGEDLKAIGQKLNELAQMDLPAFAAEMRYMADRAPKLSDEEIYRSVQLMDKVIEGQVIPGKKIQIMVDRGVDIAAVKPVVYSVLGHENVSIYETDLGVIEPNIYLQVYQVLKEVQAVLAGLASLVFTVVFLALDHTAVMSVLRRRRVGEKAGGRRFWQAFFYSENLYGALIGGLLLSAMFALSGGGIPYMKWYFIPLIGVGIGLLTAQLTEKITPVSAEEILAGQSLGMSFEEIMREIIIPSARPGLLQRLNRPKLKFK